MKSLILSVIVLVCISCSDPYPTIISNYTIENNSGHDVSLIVYNATNDTINIANNDKYAMVKKYDGEIASPFECDSIGLTFDLSKKVIYSWQNASSRNPLLIENYTKEKVGENAYELKYFITGADFDNIQN